MTLLLYVIVVLPEDFDFESSNGSKLMMRVKNRNNKLDIYPFKKDSHADQLKDRLEGFMTIRNDVIPKGILYLEFEND